MALSENDARAFEAALVAAAILVDGWQRALGLLARASGTWAGQLLGLSAPQGLVFHVEHSFSPEDMQEARVLSAPRLPAMHP